MKVCEGQLPGPGPETGAASGIRVADAAWPEIDTRLAGGALALLPIGAAAKAHGRHLPLATDYLQVQWLADRIIERRDVVVWPTLSYGHYPAFVDYPGSTSLSRGTFISVVAEILQGLKRAGARCIAILNTGISTIEPLEHVIRTPRIAVPVGLINVYAGPRLARVQGEVEQQSWGGHADEIETSLMLAIAPDQVEMRRAEAAPSRIGPGPFNRSDSGMPNYSPAGVTGDPTLATRSKGEALLSAWLDDVLAGIDAFQGIEQ